LFGKAHFPFSFFTFDPIPQLPVSCQRALSSACRPFLLPRLCFHSTPLAKGNLKFAEHSRCRVLFPPRQEIGRRCDSHERFWCPFPPLTCIALHENLMTVRWSDRPFRDVCSSELPHPTRVSDPHMCDFAPSPGIPPPAHIAPRSARTFMSFFFEEMSGRDRGVSYLVCGSLLLHRLVTFTPPLTE